MLAIPRPITAFLKMSSQGSTVLLSNNVIVFVEGSQGRWWPGENGWVQERAEGEGAREIGKKMLTVTTTKYG